MASPAPRDRPVLLPSNRKLRNLTSLSLRNLSLINATPSRLRGKTIDDDAIPQTLHSPAKIVALREHHGLEHSRSSGDLKTRAQEDAVSEIDGDGSPVKGKRNEGARRPALTGARRRRSTLEWANATPLRRQERLESVTRERMADVFFSVHVEGVEEPIYVSETVEKSMNPTFRHVDFSACGAGITRMDTITLKIWVRQVKSRQWRLLIELHVSLPNLHYLSKHLDQIPIRLPPNALLFHLTDGIYTLFSTHLAPSGPVARAGSSARLLPTSTFDALLRLSKLDDSIHDALAVRDTLASSLEALLVANKTALQSRDSVPEAADRLKTIEYAKQTVQKQLEKARTHAQEKRSSLLTRRNLMASDLAQRKLECEILRTSRPSELPTLRAEREVRRKAIQSQRRRVCEDFQKIYPITPVSGQSLAFTIRDLRFPSSDDDVDSEPPETIAAALGYVCHILLLLSHYLAQPLVYPVNPQNSTSTVSDPISMLKTSSSGTLSSIAGAASAGINSAASPTPTYPLWPKGVPRFRFDYAVFLLNKNIQILLESAYGVRVQDVRHTLPNLKYLFYLATAAPGEVPGRKKGGVRGLLARSGIGGRDDGMDGKVAAVESLRRNIARSGPGSGGGAGRKRM